MICDKLSSNSIMSGQAVLTKGLLFDVPALFNPTTLALHHNSAFLLGILAFFCFTSATASYRISESSVICYIGWSYFSFKLSEDSATKQGAAIFTPVSVVQSHFYSETFKVFL